MKTRVGHEFGMCPVHRTRAKPVSDMCPTHVPISGHMSRTERDLGSCFLMQVGAVRCFDVQLRVILQI